MKTLIAIGAHHDDVELRCGGTLAKYVNDGWHVVYVVATTTPHYALWPEETESGRCRSNAEVIELRKAESRRGAAALGVTEVEFFDFKSLYWYKDGTHDRRYFDGHALSVEEFRYLNERAPGREFIVSATHCPAAMAFLRDFLRERAADIVLTHFPEDAHWEHYATGAFVAAAVRELVAEGAAIELYAWEPAGRNLRAFAPTHFEDITATLEAKCRAVAGFTSQFKELRGPEADLWLDWVRNRAREYGALAGVPCAEPFMRFDVEAHPKKGVRLAETYDAARAKLGLA
ncbi:MAG: PIG-L family deacetylase [Kiritimatiellae bacterium]|nr:PIG-L family deacetylase [Kiritimatiellia bacterium]